MRNRKKRHTGRRSLVEDKIQKYNKDIFYYDKLDNTNSAKDFKSAEDKDDDEKITHIYKLFYAELIKLFVIEASPKSSNLTELYLDQNIFLAAHDYYNFSNDMYEVPKLLG